MAVGVYGHVRLSAFKLSDRLVVTVECGSTKARLEGFEESI